jgi:hypothetical protein
VGYTCAQAVEALGGLGARKVTVGCHIRFGHGPNLPQPSSARCIPILLEQWKQVKGTNKALIS